jgi:hypothetical protein
MLTFIQIFSQFKKNYGIRWPFLTSTYMRWLSSFNLDIIRILPVDCLYQTNYYDVLMATILMPFAVLVVCAGVSAIGRLYVQSLLYMLVVLVVSLSVHFQFTFSTDHMMNRQARITLNVER